MDQLRQQQLAAAAQAVGNSRLATTRGFGWSREMCVAAAMERARELIQGQGGDLKEFEDLLRLMEEHFNQVF